MKKKTPSLQSAKSTNKETVRREVATEFLDGVIEKVVAKLNPSSVVADISSSTKKGVEEN